MRPLLFSALFALSLSAVACGPKVDISTPPGFAVLDKQEEYVYRATSAEGVVLAVRGEKNDPAGNLEFWADAVTQKLLTAGYALDGEPREVRTRRGFVGRQVRLSRESQRRPQRLWITVFVTQKHVFVVEAGGDAERFKERAEAAVQKAIESVGVD
jgi:hypothetical protein